MDESTNLTSSFHRAGFTHVIGTLWSVTDLSESHLAAGIYQAMSVGTPEPTLDFARAAPALRALVRDLRASYPDNSVLWANYVHVGP